MQQEPNCKIIGYGAIRDAHMCITHDGRIMAISSEVFNPATIKSLFSCGSNDAFKDSNYILLEKYYAKVLYDIIRDLVRKCGVDPDNQESVEELLKDHFSIAIYNLKGRIDGEIVPLLIDLLEENSTAASKTENRSSDSQEV